MLNKRPAKQRRKSKEPAADGKNQAKEPGRDVKSENNVEGQHEKDKEKNKMLIIFMEESGKNENWNKKYIHSTMYLLGYGAYGSVFQVTTRLYPQSKQKIANERYTYHPDFLAVYASRRKLRTENPEKLKDKFRNTHLLDAVAIKYEMLEQSQLEDGVTRFFMFLRREFLVLHTIWQKCPGLLVGFPALFDFGYLGDRMQYGVNPKYRDIFTYLNLQGEEVKFFGDSYNRSLDGVTKICYMTMELLGPSIEDYRSYFAPWYDGSSIRPFFQVRTAFRIADQLLCRLFVLHKAGFVHHDLKPDNLMVGTGRALNTIYLNDFGFAKQVADTPISEWMGTRKYIAIDTYNNEKPNYAQDIESWFYVTVAMLYDLLPWSDEVIEPMMEQPAEEGAKWALNIAIKKTWWGELSEAETLHTVLDRVQTLHGEQVPDVRQLLEMLHRKTRDLRNHLRQYTNSTSLNAELGNNQSSACKGYMNIRKVLLHIFDLPNVSRSPLLFDHEFRAFQDARRERGLRSFTWDPNNFEWEWDTNHQLMISSKSSISPEEGLNAMTSTTEQSVKQQEQPKLMPQAPGFNSPIESTNSSTELLTEAHNRDRIRAQVAGLAADLRSLHPDTRRLHARAIGDDGSEEGPCGRRRVRPDEVSYVYNRADNTLVPKVGQHRPVRKPATASGAEDQGPQQLWELNNPSCLF